MKVTIDAAGRLVVPKVIRNQLGLQGRMELEIRVCEGRLEIEPSPTPMRLVRRGKGLVAISDEPLPALGADDVRAIIEATRR